MLRKVCWLALSLATVACAPPRHGTQSADQRALPRAGLEIRYRVDAARPATHFDLSIPAIGDAELVLLHPLASAASPLGRFRAPLTTDTRAKLERFVREHGLLDADPEESATAEGSGSISLTTAEGHVDLGLASYEPARNELRAELDRVVLELVAHPVAAIRTELGARRVTGGLVPIVSLVHVGSEPLVLVERDLVVSLIATGRPPAGPPRNQALEKQAVHELVAAGKLASGVTQLSPGQRIDLPLSSPVEPGSHLSVRGFCWVPGEGRSRSALALLAEGELK